MKTCETCRFWSAKGREKWDVDKQEMCEQRLHACAAVIHENGDYVDRLLDGQVVDHPLAVVRDGSGYSATFYTDASFGCVLHEDRKS